MILVLIVLQVLLLLVIVYQDFKTRTISWYLLPLLLIGFVSIALLQIEFSEFVRYVGVNFILVLLNLIGVTAFVVLRERKWVNIIDIYLGLGDVLFFLVLTFAFSPINFMLFYLGSIFFITLVYGVKSITYQQENRLIPLAGAMSICLITVLITEHLFPSFQLYHDLLVVHG